MRSRWPWLLLALVPTMALANGGGPILLIVNGFLFTIGQIWIVLAEFFYLARRAPNVPKWRLLKLVVGINVASTLGGALLLPLLWAAVFAALSALGPWRDSTFGGVLIALGTWVVGDNSPFPWLALASSSVLFVGTYFATVWIEYRLMQRWSISNRLSLATDVLSLSYRMNALSYLGLIILFVLGVTIFKGTRRIQARSASLS